jgi:hypothetical protein
MSHYLIMRVDSRKAKRNLSLVRDPSLAEVQFRNLLVVCGDLRTGEEGRWLQKTPRTIAAIIPAEGLNRGACFP